VLVLKDPKFTVQLERLVLKAELEIPKKTGSGLSFGIDNSD